MSATVKFFVLCDGHAESGGKHNLLGIFDQLRTTSFPTAVAKCYVVAHFKADPGKHIGRLSFVSSATEENLIPPIEMPKLKVESNALSPGAYLICEFQNLLIPKEGFYSFHLEIDGEHVAEAELSATLLKEKK